MSKKNRKHNRKNTGREGTVKDYPEPAAARPASIIEHPLWIITAVFLLTAALRVTAPSDLDRGDQPKQADYVVDIAVRGNWLVQHHQDDVIATKPPLYNWLAAPLIMLSGKPSEILLKLPSLAAGLLSLFMLWDIARRLFPKKAALYAAIFTATSMMYAKQIYFARTDMLMTMFIIAQLWAVVRREKPVSGGVDKGIPGKGAGDSSKDEKSTPSSVPRSSCRDCNLWVFWAAGGLGILTKGPPAILIPHLVIAAWWLWERRLISGYRSLGLWWGIPVTLAPTAAWAAAIYFVEGPETFRGVYNSMIGSEMADRFSSASSKSMENRPFYYYVPHLLARNLPWSLFAAAGLFLVPWKSFRRRGEVSEPVENKNSSDAKDALIGGSSTDTELSGAVFASCWLAAVLLMFSVIPSKRVDRVFPAVPAMGLLAAWVYEAFARRFFAVGTRGGVEKPESGAVNLGKRTGPYVTWVLRVLLGISAIAGIFLIAGVSAGESGLLDSVKLSADLRPAFVFRRSTAMLVGIIISGSALAAVYAWRFRMRALFTAAIVVSSMMFLTGYYHLFSASAKNPRCEYAERACRIMRNEHSVTERGCPIVILTGYKAPLRFYLMRPEKRMFPEEAALFIAGHTEPVIVVGSYPEIKDGEVVKPNALGETGARLHKLGDLRPARPMRVTAGPNLPVDTLLGFVEYEQIRK